jgi:hypothetical protein
MLKEEHAILKKPSGLLPNEEGSLRVHRSKPHAALDRDDVSAVRGDACRVLRVAAPRAERAQ